MKIGVFDLIWTICLLYMCVYNIGEIPKAMGRLRRLKFLSLANNALDGTIPLSFKSLYFDKAIVELNGNQFLQGMVGYEDKRINQKE